MVITQELVNNCTPEILAVLKKYTTNSAEAKLVLENINIDLYSEIKVPTN